MMFGTESGLESHRLISFIIAEDFGETAKELTGCCTRRWNINRVNGVGGNC